MISTRSWKTAFPPLSAPLIPPPSRSWPARSIVFSGASTSRMTATAGGGWPPVSIGAGAIFPPCRKTHSSCRPLRAFPAKSSVAAFRTSGTTGEGYGIHEFCSLRLYDEAILRGWDLLRLPALPQLILVPPPAAAPHSSLSYMMGRLAARASDREQHWFIGTAGALDTEALDAALEVFRPPGPASIVARDGAGVSALCEAGPELVLPDGSLAFETGGYKGSGRTLAKADLYARMERHLGIPPLPSSTNTG